MNDTRSTFRQFAITERRPAEQYKTLREGDVLRCENKPVKEWHRKAAQEVFDASNSTPPSDELAQLIANAEIESEDKTALIAALAHAAYRTHEPNPEACSGCEAVAKFLNEEY